MSCANCSVIYDKRLLNSMGGKTVRLNKHCTHFLPMECCIVASALGVLSNEPIGDLALIVAEPIMRQLDIASDLTDGGEVWTTLSAVKAVMAKFSLSAAKPLKQHE